MSVSGKPEIVGPRDLVLAHGDTAGDLREIFAEGRLQISRSISPNRPARSSDRAQRALWRSAST